MLDTNTVLNREEDRDITSYLYGRDRRLRLKQEIVLGIGGIRALRRLGIRPSVLHMNEGHSAFAILERIASGWRKTAFPSKKPGKPSSAAASSQRTLRFRPALTFFERGAVASVLGNTSGPSESP